MTLQALDQEGLTFLWQLYLILSLLKWQGNKQWYFIATIVSLKWNYLTSSDISLLLLSLSNETTFVNLSVSSHYKQKCCTSMQMSAKYFTVNVCYRHSHRDRICLKLPCFGRKGVTPNYSLPLSCWMGSAKFIGRKQRGNFSLSEWPDIRTGSSPRAYQLWLVCSQVMKVRCHSSLVFSLLPHPFLALYLCV